MMTMLISINFISFIILVLITIPILHIFHIRGDNKIPFPTIFRGFTRYEEFFMKLMFKILRSDFIFKHKAFRPIMELISKLAGGLIQPSVFSLETSLSLIPWEFMEYTISNSEVTSFPAVPGFNLHPNFSS